MKEIKCIYKQNENRMPSILVIDLRQKQSMHAPLININAINSIQIVCVCVMCVWRAWPVVQNLIMDYITFGAFNIVVSDDAVCTESMNIGRQRHAHTGTRL